MFENGKRSEQQSLWKPFLVLFGAGLAGVLSLAPFARRQVEKALSQAEEAPKLPLPAVVAIALVQSAGLLALAVYGGLKLAPGLGLRSHLVDAVQPRRGGGRRPFGWKAALAGALLVPAAILAGERLFRPWTGEALERLEEENPRDLSMTLMGVLYGGITEELLMRWGLVSLLARALQRLRGAGETPAGAVLPAAISASAILFGLGHLPALAAMATLTPALIARTVLLNAAGGLVFGYLFWKESLEAAVAAHAGSHVVLSLAQRGKRGGAGG